MMKAHEIEVNPDFMPPAMEKLLKYVQNVVGKPMCVHCLELTQKLHNHMWEHEARRVVSIAQELEGAAGVVSPLG